MGWKNHPLKKEWTEMEEKQQKKDRKPRTIKQRYLKPEDWEKVNIMNRQITDEFIDAKRDLSDKSLEQYENALKIFFIWVYRNAGDKFITDLKKRDILRFQNWMGDKGLGLNTIRFKRSAVSSLCNYLETYYDDEYPNFRNIVKGVETPKGKIKHKKEPLTIEELNLLREELEKESRWQELAFLELAYSTGGRREEIRQIRKEVLDYEPTAKGFYITHEVRTKGEGKEGNIRQLAFSEEAKKAVERWIKHRGEDDCEFLFITNYGGGKKQISATTFNYWCTHIFTPIVGRRVHPHQLRSTRATHIVTVDGKDINSAKNLLGHKQSSTTEIYVVRDEEESLGEAF